MKLFYTGKDGGPDSTVWGFWLIEWKRWFSIAVLCFEDGSREAYHQHAFNSISWLLSGTLEERVLLDMRHTTLLRGYTPSLWPIWTPRACYHKVTSFGRSWVLTFRGPWRDRWQEYLPLEDRERTLTHGRIEL